MKKSNFPLPSQPPIPTINNNNKEDNEVQQLSDLIMQTLDASGQLASVKAMIRQQVFNVVNNEKSLANQPDGRLDKKEYPSTVIKYQSSQSNKKNTTEQSSLNMSNKKLQNALENEDEKITLLLIKELLDYYDMDYTSNIFTNEANLNNVLDRNQLASKTKTNKSDKKPLLAQIVSNALSGKISTNNNNNNSYETANTTNTSLNNKSKKEEPSKIITSNNNNNNKKEIAGTNKYSSTKFDNIKNESHNYEQNDIEESMGGFDELSDEDNDYKQPQQQKSAYGKNNNSNAQHARKNPMFSSMEDTIGASMSHNQDQSVDSMKLEEDCDYRESIS